MEASGHCSYPEGSSRPLHPKAPSLHHPQGSLWCSSSGLPILSHASCSVSWSLSLAPASDPAALDAWVTGHLWPVFCCLSNPS